MEPGHCGKVIRVENMHVESKGRKEEEGRPEKEGLSKMLIPGRFQASDFQQG